MIIPKNNRWTQLNSDFFGSIYASKGIDLYENEGRLRLGKKILLNTSNADVSEITSAPVGFRYFNSQFWTIAGTGITNNGYIFKASSLITSWTKVTGGSAPSRLDSLTDDIEVWNGYLIVTSSVEQKIYYSTDGSSWSSTTAGGAGDAMMLCFYGSRLYNSKSGNQIQSSDTSFSVSSPTAAPNPNAVSNTIRLINTDLVITFLRSTSSGIWIGTVNTKGGKGFVFRWDGASVSINESFKLESSGALSCTVKDDVPWIMDSFGRLMQFNGGTFVEKARFFRTRNKLLFNPFYRTNQRFIHPNGLGLINHKLNMLVDLTNYDAADHAGTQEETMPSGIYEYDENKGLYNKYSIGLSKTSESVVDYGQFRIYLAGGLNEVITAQAPITTDGTFLVGCSYRGDSTKSLTGYSSGIFYNNSDDTKAKAGYVITTKVETENLTEEWNSIYGFFKKLLNSSDKIVVKYRTDDSVSYEDIAITWYNGGAVFKTSSSISSWTVGDEVEIIQGKGSGLCAHITAINSLGGGVTEVSIDDSISALTNTDTAIARFGKWKKTKTYQSQSEDFTQFSIGGATSQWIQFKIYMIFIGANEIRKFNLISNAGQQAD